MGSIVLNPGVKEMLLEDTKDFLRSEKVCTTPHSPPPLAGKRGTPGIRGECVTPTSK